MSDQVYLLSSGFMDESRAKEHVARQPKAKQEMEHNVRLYGVPFLSGKIGWMKRSEIGENVDDLLNRKMKAQLLELTVYARDGQGEEYAIQYDVLRRNGNEFFEKAVAYEERMREKRGGNNARRKGQDIADIPE